MKKIFKSGDYIEAQIVLGLLQSYGFAAKFSGDYLVGGVGELPASDLFVLRVPETEYAEASKIIAEYQNGDLNLDP